MTAVRVYGKPGCSNCTLECNLLRARGVEVEYIDVTADEAAMQTIVDLGYLGVPVTIDGDDHWQGIDRDRLNECIEKRSALGVSKG